jgi:hypothetical protein
MGFNSAFKWLNMSLHLHAKVYNGNGYVKGSNLPALLLISGSEERFK